MLKDRLISLRKNHRKTQEDIAKIIGVSRPAYTAYEKGNRSPDYKILVTLAEYYDVTIDYLLGHSDYPQLKEKDSEVQKLLKDPLTEVMFDNWKHMSEEERKEALDVIRYIQFKKKEEE